jgi:hypothetical protein
MTLTSKNGFKIMDNNFRLSKEKQNNSISKTKNEMNSAVKANWQISKSAVIKKMNMI